jgi:hypothetical protein
VRLTLLIHLAAFFKLLTRRKVHKKTCLTPQNLAKPSSLMGFTLLWLAYAVDNPHIYFIAFGLAESGGVFITCAMILGGMYAILSEKA